MLAVRGIYDGKNVFVKEPVPLEKECEVIVTFITLPEISNREETSVEKRMAALNRLVGIASQNPLSLEEARAERFTRQLNMPDYANSPVPAITPTDFIASLS